MNTALKPQKIHLHKQSKTLEVVFADKAFHLPAELLRVHSPSAEVQGHGKPVLVGGKINVGIKNLKPSGQYGVLIIFDDGHDSGIFSWRYLYDLGQNQEAYWQDYLERLDKAEMSRDPDTRAVKLLL